MCAAGLWVEEGGEDMIMDLGLPVETFGPGEGDAVLEKGLLRFCPGLEAILQWLLVGSRDEFRAVLGTRQHQDMRPSASRDKSWAIKSWPGLNRQGVPSSATRH